MNDICLNTMRAQGKLVRCTRGAIFDVAVDIRRGSPAFSKWFGIELSDANKLMLWVPPGFAHGFCAMEEGSDLVYKRPRHLLERSGDRDQVADRGAGAVGEG